MKKLVLFLIIPVIFFSCKKDNNSNTTHSNINLTDSFSNLSPGAAASYILGSAKYTTLSVEIQYMPGYQPGDAVVNNIQTFLNTYCSKPNGINYVLEPVATRNKDTLTLDDVKQIEASSRVHYTNGNNIWLYILVTDGYNTDSTILGTAYRSTSLCVYGKTVYDHSGRLFQVNRNTLFSTVIEHEFGHLFGLVNLGSKMQVDHEDTIHPGHCNNQNCLMYYTSESTAVLNFLLGGTVPTFDDNCVNDLKGNGSK